LPLILPRCQVYFYDFILPKTKNMKSNTIIIAAVLSLQVSALFTKNHETGSAANYGEVFCPLCELAPITPLKATFEEMTELIAYPVDFLFLTPVTPEEAEFTDLYPIEVIDITLLAPVTPEEADFEETYPQKVNNK